MLMQGLTIKGLSCGSCGWPLLAYEALSGERRLAGLAFGRVCVAGWRACLHSAHMQMSLSAGKQATVAERTARHPPSF